MAKKFYNSDESKHLSDLDILPHSSLLYMTLRVAFEQSVDCGLYRVTIKEMMTMTGLDRSVITTTLLPELSRHGLVVWDNNIVFVENTPITESCVNKLRSGNTPCRVSFLKAYNDCKEVASAVSSGGINLAVKSFVEFWRKAGALYMSRLEFLKAKTTLDKEETKELEQLPTGIEFLQNCNILSNSAENTTHTAKTGNQQTKTTQPTNQNGATHTEPTPNPHRTHTEPTHPIPTTVTQDSYQNETTHYGIGIGKRKEEEFLTLQLEERIVGGVGFSRQKNPIPDENPGEISDEFDFEFDATTGDVIEKPRTVEMNEPLSTFYQNGNSNGAHYPVHENIQDEGTDERANQAGTSGDDSDDVHTDSG